MNRQKYRRLVLVDLESLNRALETRKSLAPDQPLVQAVRKIAESVGVDEAGVERVMGWGGEKWPATVGEMRRPDRIKLAREMYRFWQPGAGLGSASFALNRA